MEGGMGAFAILPALYVVKQLDFEDPETIMWTRIAFVGAHALIAAIHFYTYTKIKASPDGKKIDVPVEKQMGMPADGPTHVEMTEKEYDISEFKKLMQQFGMTLLVIGVMHVYWNFMQPLLIQAMMAPMRIYGSKLFKIHVLGQQGEDLERPWKPPAGPFGNLQEQMKTLQGEEPPKKAPKKVKRPDPQQREEIRAQGSKED